MKAIKTEKELIEATGLTRHLLKKEMKDSASFQALLNSHGIQWKGKPIRFKDPDPPEDAHEWDVPLRETIGKIAAVKAEIAKLERRLNELNRMKKALEALNDSSESEPERQEKMENDQDMADGNEIRGMEASHDPFRNIDELYSDMLSEPVTEARIKQHTIALFMENCKGRTEDCKNEAATQRKFGYDLWPPHDYDLYGKTFGMETRKEFLDIKRGEYWAQFAMLPQGYTARSLTSARKRCIKELFKPGEFLNMPIRSQVKCVCWLSCEMHEIIHDMLLNADQWLTGEHEWDMKVSRFAKNFEEWRLLLYQYYLRFVVNPTTVEKNACTGERVTAYNDRVTKEQVDKWENLRLKWLEYLPRDIQNVSFRDIPEYVVRANPDAWVNPDTDKVEIRKPKASKPSDDDPFEDKVRHWTDGELEAFLAICQDKMKTERDDAKKAEMRSKGLIVRNEKLAREGKYDRS